MKGGGVAIFESLGSLLGDRAKDGEEGSMSLS